ncbi:MAG: Rpn family recombination-promoting nuclease/putative transposase [Clostridium sp.]|nr:Rpn family recombination-promoting nuclease/putative transposase [Clostridium sp.]
MAKQTTNHNFLNLPSGKLPYTLTNDYMFRSVFQKNQNALKGLLCALLGLTRGSIREVTILNPIILGETIDEKTCVLDLHLRLNHNEFINIEMQVNDFGDWPERSITYLCRTFDQLQKGDIYSNIHATIHIGIVDFNLPGLTPEFYSEYKLMNVKNHEIYSDKLSLRMLNLKSMEDDSIEKKPDDLYFWARLFKATTWEELKMLAMKNSDIKDTVVTLHELTDDEKIKLQCEARERYERDMASAIAKGKREGMETGLREGEKQALQLFQKLIKDGRSDLIEKAANDAAYLEELYKEYGI